VEPGNGFYAANAPREVKQKAGRGRERGTERARGSFWIALKMQAGSVDSAAGTGCKASPRCRRAKGRIEERASTGKGIADAHQRFDPQPGKTGGGEQGPGGEGSDAGHRHPCSTPGGHDSAGETRYGSAARDKPLKGKPWTWQRDETSPRRQVAE
jgi:hypothetical protein